MMKKFNLYKFVAKFYKDNFDVPPEVFLLMSIRVTLLLCASGLSNETISTFFSIDKHFVDETVKHMYKFDGWEKDLDYNPLYYYKIGKPLEVQQLLNVTQYIKTFKKIEPYYK
jgi:hypothetical protein